MINLKSDFVRVIGCHYLVVSEGIGALLWEARLHLYCDSIVAKNIFFVNAYMGFVAITHLQIIEKSGKYLFSSRTK